MASTAFDEFQYNVLDARRLHQAHGIATGCRTLTCVT